MKKLLGLLLLTSACGFTTVDEGYRGITSRFGKVIDEPLPPGLHFYNPFTTSVQEFEVREQKVEGVAQCYTRDTQTAVIKYAVTFYASPEAVLKTYIQYGTQWKEKAVIPSVEARIKDAIGQYVADEIIENQARASQSAFDNLNSTLAERGVTLGSLNFVNVDFSDEYENAVEQKVVAIQSAQEAKNKTVQIKEEAEQRILSAKAEAESMRIRSVALSQNKGLVEYEAVQKWDGKLPEYMMGQSTPFINLGAKK